MLEIVEIKDIVFERIGGERAKMFNECLQHLSPDLIEDLEVRINLLLNKQIEMSPDDLNRNIMEVINSLFKDSVSVVLGLNFTEETTFVNVFTFFKNTIKVIEFNEEELIELKGIIDSDELENEEKVLYVSRICGENISLIDLDMIEMVEPTYFKTIKLLSLSAEQNNLDEENDNRDGVDNDLVVKLLSRLNEVDESYIYNAYVNGNKITLEFGINYISKLSENEDTFNEEVIKECVILFSILYGFDGGIREVQLNQDIDESIKPNIIDDLRSLLGDR